MSLEEIGACHVFPEFVRGHRVLYHIGSGTGVAVVVGILITEAPIEIPQRTECDTPVGSALILKEECTLGVVNLLVQCKVIGKEETGCSIHIEHLLKVLAVEHGCRELLDVIDDAVHAHIGRVLVEFGKVGLAHLHRELILAYAGNRLIGICIELEQVSESLIDIHAVVSHTHLLGKHVATHICTVHVELYRNDVVRILGTGHLAHLHCYGIGH